MTSFSRISLDEIKLDCRYYTGYKPCHRFDGCPNCPHYEARGEQILIIKLGAMGDVLRTKAILPALKRQNPKSWIVWLTNPGSESLVHDPMVNEVHALSVAGIEALKGREFSKIYCLDKDKEALSLSASLNGKKRYGFAPTPYNTVTVWNEASMYALRLGLSDELKFFENEKNAMEIVAEMCELPYAGEVYNLMIPEKACINAQKKWDAMGIPPGYPVVGLNTGCGPVFETKAWTKEGFSELVQLLNQAGIPAVLLGGPRERALHQELLQENLKMVGTLLFDSGNDNSLEDFFGLVDQCKLVVTADSLALHIAIALRKKVVTFFGPTCHQEVELFGLGEKFVTDFKCSPCYLKKCPHDISCMMALKAPTIFNLVKSVLGDEITPSTKQ